MKVLFDVSIVGYSRLNAQYRTGIYQVAVALLRALAAQPGVEVVAYSSSGNHRLARRILDREGLAQVPVAGSDLWGALAFVLVLARNVVHRIVSPALARILTRLLEAAQNRRGAADARLLRSAHWYLSPMEAPPEFVRKVGGLRVALVLHDLIPLVLDDYRQDPSDPTRWFPKMVRNLRPTDTLFTVSEFTKRDFLRLFPTFSADRLVVAPNAVDPQRFGPGPLRPDAGTYFLTVSTVEPRKRIESIVEAFQVYRRAGGTARLVVCGANRQGHRDHVLTRLDQDLRAEVEFTGYLADGELPPLYRSCLAFVYVSEYEGFGLPVLEAMACGAPVVVSDRTSLPEVAGPAGIVVSPDDVPSLAGALSLLAGSPEERSARSRKSLAQAGEFSWNKTAAIVVQTFGRPR
jgi:glycosyltransferase involved in cell wall biosynthesis